MSGLDQIFESLHQNINEGKLYEALMQYKSLFNRYSRRSFEHGIAIIQDGVEQFSKQTDLNAYFGLIEFYEKYLEAHANLINEKSLIPFGSIIELPVSEDKLKYEKMVVELINSTSFDGLKIKFNRSLGISYMKTGNINKALEIFINDLDDIYVLFNYNKEHNVISVERLFILTIVKVLLSNNPSNARKVYQFVQDNYNTILDSKSAQIAIVYIILIMKLIENKDKKEDIELAFNKATTTFETTLRETYVSVFVDELKSKYFPKTQTNSNPFASLMQTMMQGQH